MGRRMEWEQDFPNGTTATFVLAKTWPETVALYCEGCERTIPPSPYWPFRNTHWMHESGTGHKVRRLALA